MFFQGSLFFKNIFLQTITFNSCDPLFCNTEESMLDKKGIKKE